MSFRAIALTLTILLVPITIIGQTRNGSAKAESEVRHADDEFQKAFRDEDATALEKLLTDDFIWTHCGSPDGIFLHGKRR